MDAEQYGSQNDAEGDDRLEYRPDEPMYCYNCAAELPGDRRHCPDCGRSLFRTCYCGVDIPVTYKTCPSCEANWSQSARVRKKKSKSRSSSPAKSSRIGLYAACGAAAAILLLGVAQAVLNAVARGSLSPGEAMPTSGLERLMLTAQTFQSALSYVGAFLVSRIWSLLGLLLVIVIGAAGGAIYYITITRANHGERNHRSVRRREPSGRGRRA